MICWSFFVVLQTFGDLSSEFLGVLYVVCCFWCDFLVSFGLAINSRPFGMFLFFLGFWKATPRKGGWVLLQKKLS